MVPTAVETAAPADAPVIGVRPRGGSRLGRFRACETEVRLANGADPPIVSITARNRERERAPSKRRTRTDGREGNG